MKIENPKKATDKFFRLQARLDRFDLPLYNMLGFIEMHRDLLREMDVDWVEVRNKWLEWKRWLERMIRILDENVWGEQCVH